tara:strand:+ start:223 stop:564 length:342 start_codon:yes stop_codon:yes gene_type:complete
MYLIMKFFDVAPDNLVKLHQLIDRDESPVVSGARWWMALSRTGGRSLGLVRFAEIVSSKMVEGKNKYTIEVKITPVIKVFDSSEGGSPHDEHAPNNLIVEICDCLDMEVYSSD